MKLKKLNLQIISNNLGEGDGFDDGNDNDNDTD